MASATDNLRHTDAERATLGAVLLNSVALETVSKHVEPSDYYEPKHSIIFSAIRDLQQEGTRADLLTLTDKLSEDGNLERAGGAAYISGLTDSVPTDANVEYYARIVADRAHRRRYSETINGIQKDLKNPSATLEEIRHRMAEAAPADSGT
ncbi:MAG: replicative DNA helicase, partial [Spirochaetia bacterium]|nr:replicative DNA helicase [Spirochaetia bacterium]